MRVVSRSAIALMLLVAACNLGHQPQDFPTAMGPAGVHVAVRVRGETSDRVGELYVADSIGVMVRGERLMRVTWPSVEAMDVLNLGSEYDIAFGETVSAAKRDRLAIVSRFPQGLSGALLQRVLSLIAQSAVDSLR